MAPARSAKVLRSAKRIVGALVLVGAATATAYIVKETRESPAGASLAALNCASPHAAWRPACSPAPGTAPARVAAADPRTTGTVERNAKKRSSSAKDAAKKTEVADASAAPRATQAPADKPPSLAPHAKTGEPVRAAELPRTADAPTAPSSADSGKNGPARAPAQAAANTEAPEAPAVVETRAPQAPPKVAEARPRRAPTSVTETGSLSDKPVVAAKAPASPAAVSEPDKVREAAPPPAANSGARQTSESAPAAEKPASTATAQESGAIQPNPGTKRQKLARVSEPERAGPIATPKPEPQLGAKAPSSDPAESPKVALAPPVEATTPAAVVPRREPVEDPAPAAEAVTPASKLAKAEIEPLKPVEAASSESVRNPAIEARRRALSETRNAEAAAEARIASRRLALQARRAERRKEIARAEAAAERAEAAAERRHRRLVTLRERRRARMLAARPAPQRLVKYRLVHLRMVESGVIPGHSFPPEFAQALRQYNTSYRAEPAYGPLPW